MTVPCSLARGVALATVALALTGCGGGADPAAARVDCGTPGPHGVDCEVRRTGGEVAFEACWTLAISCRNGAVMTGSACHVVPAGIGSGTANMPVAGFSGQDGCDAPANGKVEALKITPQ